MKPNQFKLIITFHNIYINIHFVPWQKKNKQQYQKVKWPNAECRLGNSFTISQVNTKPKFSWNCSPKKYYTLLVADLDPLGKNGLLSEVRYYGIGNIHNCDFDTGDVFCDYLPPTPIYDTPPHRFVYLLYERSSPVKFEGPFIRST